MIRHESSVAQASKNSVAPQEDMFVELNDADMPPIDEDYMMLESESESESESGSDAESGDDGSDGSATDSGSDTGSGSESEEAEADDKKPAKKGKKALVQKDG